MPQHPPANFKKPAVLYHGSQNRHIDEFVPRAENVRDKSEGPVIFAALEKATAAIHMHPFNGSKMSSGFINEIPYILVGKPKEFHKQDTGGAIYTLPSDRFSFNPDLGIGYKEWTSTVPVKPNAREEYDSALEIMLDLGVQAYMADMKTLRKFQKAEGAKLELIESLTSENQKQNRNYKPFRNPKEHA